MRSVALVLCKLSPTPSPLVFCSSAQQKTLEIIADWNLWPVGDFGAVFLGLDSQASQYEQCRHRCGVFSEL